MKSCSRLYGISKFEFLIVIVICSVLATVLLTHIDQTRADAEHAEVDLTLRHMRIGLQMAVSELVMAGKDDDVRGLGQRNPFRYLESMPKGYEGERSVPLHAGGWVYDPVQSMVLYRPRMPAAFEGRLVLRWQLRARAASTEKMSGWRIESVE